MSRSKEVAQYQLLDSGEGMSNPLITPFYLGITIEKVHYVVNAQDPISYQGAGYPTPQRAWKLQDYDTSLLIAIVEEIENPEILRKIGRGFYMKSIEYQLVRDAEK